MTSAWAISLEECVPEREDEEVREEEDRELEEVSEVEEVELVIWEVDDELLLVVWEVGLRDLVEFLRRGEDFERVSRVGERE